MHKPKPVFDTVIVRFGGEIGIKAAWTRRFYERRLAANIRAALKHYAIYNTRLIRSYGRIYIKTTKARKAARRLSKVFGVSSLSPAVETTSDISDIIKTSILLASSTFIKGNSFAVRCHRVGEHPYKSQEVCQQVGQQVLDNLRDLEPQVDLSYPERILHIEVRDDKAYLFTYTVKGAGGLPLGTQPKTICLLKDDVSSAVACWMTMKRGCPAVLVHFVDSISTEKSGIERVLNDARKLTDWSIGFPTKLYSLRQPENLVKFIRKQPHNLGDILHKRFLFRTTEAIAEIKKAEAIVTGDMLEERLSQALAAFKIQDRACKTYPIIRPLLGLERRDIEKVAGRIGILRATCAKEKEFVVETKRSEIATIDLEAIEQIEEKINIQEIMEESLKSLKVLIL